ncbi:cytochrome c family protein [Qipengyuania sp. JC766]|uniref:c-type cytochrome n=1 Tax=Qipengyuania sp. JC766 TaxID=3232139 RepID=UPI00345AA763
MDDRFNTIAGWVLFAGIIALGASSLTSKLFHGGEAERPEVLGYPIEVAEEGGADSGPPLAQLLQEGSAEAGEAVFAKCTACHTIAQGGANGIGPNLWAIMGQPIGSHAPGFAYSSALSGHGGNWGFEEMDAWLKSPRGFANGTKMSFAGLGSAEDRANVILYMLANGGGPALPEFTPEAEGEATEGEEVDGAAEGPGAIEGGEVGDVEAAGAMGAEQPVAGSNAATDAGGVKPGE